MPVSLFSGLPGSGKTATLVKRIVDLQKSEPGRPVFQFGINGLKEGLAIPLTQDMLYKWWELPHGSIICIDECQEDGSNPEQPVSLMPKDRGNPAPWVQRITKVRHHGMEFLLTTQDPANMSAYVRRLVDNHVHSVMRAKGVRQTYTWQRCIDDPNNRREKKTGEMSFASLPKEVFDLYKSSSLHTMKVKTPRMFYYMAIAAVIGVFLAFFIPYRLHKATHEVPTVAGLAGAAALQADSLRQTDYTKWVTPRVAGIPWTAPMFDKMSVKAEPRLYCIAVDDGRCTCNTEQGTHYDVPAGTCRAIAADGVYNPFLDESGKGQGDRSEPVSNEQPDGRRTAASLPAAQRAFRGDLVDGDGVSSTNHASRDTATPYIAPEYHAWVADAFGNAK
jgi:zona occludens toxin